MSWIDAFAFVCPLCRGPVTAVHSHEPGAGIASFQCTACARTYPVLLGIPDFRVSPDPWIGLEDDRAKGVALERETAGAADLEQMVRAYWRMTPNTPPAMAEWWVRARTGGSYRHHRPLGGGALRQALQAAQFEQVHVRAAALLRTDRERLSRSLLRVAVPLYAVAQRVPVLSGMLRAVAPLLDATATRGTDR